MNLIDLGGAVSCSIMPYDLRCGNSSNPIGVDYSQLRFSWKLTRTNEFFRASQNSFRIMIYKSIGDSNELSKHYFSSGWIDKKNNSNIAFQALKLESYRKYFWKLQVKDQSGIESEWTDIQSFVTGILYDEDRKGDWILANKCSVKEISDQILLSKTITYTSNDQVIMFCAAFGQYDIYVGGRHVQECLLAPIHSRIKHYGYVWYQAYDITSLLDFGENVITISGDRGWTRQVDIGNFVFWTNIAFIGPDSTIVCCSDESWKWRRSGNRYLGTFEWGDFGGEFISQKEEKHFVSNEGDKQEWFDVDVLFIDPVMRPQPYLGDSIVAELLPVEMCREDSRTIIDMGKNYTGYIEANFSLRQNEQVTLYSADKKSETNTFNQRTIYCQDGNDSTWTYKQRHNFQAGRYITIDNCPSDFTIKDIKGLAISSVGRNTAKFSTSNKLINEIYETDLWTYQACSIQGITTDCPHRERLGYGETAMSSLWGCALQNFDAKGFLEAYLTMWLDSQSDGIFPHVAPHAYGGGGTMWSSYPVIGMYDFYLAYRDRRFLESAYEKLDTWVRYLVNNKSNDGILDRYETGEWDFLGDWATPDGNDWGSSEEARFFNTCVLSLDLLTMEKIAGLLGKEGDATFYHNERIQLVEDVNRIYFQDRSQFPFIFTNTRYLAIALYSQILYPAISEELKTLFVRCLRDKGYLDGGSPGLISIMKYSIENDVGVKEIFDILNKTSYPGYGYFLHEGQTTWPEMWDMRDVYGGSRIHTCYIGISGWITRAIGGLIETTESQNGGQTYIYRPKVDLELTWVTFECETILGVIETRWEKSDSRLVISLDVPPNVTLKVQLPCDKEWSCITSAGGILEGEYKEYFEISIESGKYSIVTAYYVA